MDLKYVIKNYGIGTDELLMYREKYSQIKYLTPRKYNHVSRYTTVRRIKDKLTGKLFHENWNKKQVDSSAQDEYFVITMREENRLDIVANDYYNNPKFWWMIAIANNIIDPFDVPIGTRVRIPDVLSFYNVGGILSGS